MKTKYFIKQNYILNYILLNIHITENFNRKNVKKIDIFIYKYIFNLTISKLLMFYFNYKRI